GRGRLGGGWAGGGTVGTSPSSSGNASNSAAAATASSSSRTDHAHVKSRVPGPARWQSTETRPSNTPPAAIAIGTPYAHGGRCNAPPPSPARPANSSPHTLP